MAAQDQLRVLGPIQVVRDGVVVDLGGRRQRGLLAALVVDVGSGVSVDQLAERVWGEEPYPADPQASLRTYMSRLRHVLGDGASITAEPLGWKLGLLTLSIDAVRFEELVGAANEPGLDAHHRLALLDEALALWRGRAYEEVADYDWARVEAARLDELRITAIERRFEAMLTSGMHTDALPDLGGAVEAYPFRDRLVGLRMLALYRSGRQAEATRSFQDHRQRLADELGLEPGPDLVDLDRRIVAGDASLLAEALPGRPLRGYRLGEQLGQGAFAVVLRGTQPSLGREVAVKIIRAELANRPEFVRRFEAEAHLVARLEHPHIVPLYDYWREPDRAYLVFRYLRGGTLEARLTSSGALSLEEALSLVDQVGSALAASHGADVVHRDVKPANVFLDEDGNFYLGDFGIALEAAEYADPTAALSAGSPAYASPEQLRRESIGPSADVHGFGITLFEALTGRLPFPAASTQAELLQHQLHDSIPRVRDQRSDIPGGIDDVLARATAKDAADRYQTVDELVAEFRAALDSKPSPVVARVGVATAVSAGESHNPYKGLRAFAEADAGDFCGRERLVDRLVSVLEQTGPQGRIAAVVGPSGIGKSSVVRAGLLPALRGGQVPGSRDWFVATMLPGSDPFQELASALLRVATRVPENLMGQLTEDYRGIARVVKAVVPEGGDVLVVVDQFEELFTLVDDDTVVRLFLDSLEHAVTDARCPLRVVLTMRADFWDRPLRYGSFARLIDASTINVTALAPDELERAITEPAYRAGAEFEPGLVSEIVADVADQPGALPLLQYALTELWDDRRSGLLSREAYLEMGGVAGALSRRAEDLYSAAGPDEQAALRRIMGRLVTPGDGTEDTRRRALRSELATSPAAENMLEVCAQARLLSFAIDPATREPTVEVAHEALIRRWSRLREWLDEDRDGLRTLRHLHATAADWVARGRPDAEVYRGGRLESALAWADTGYSDLGDVEAEFLAASVSRRDAEAVAEQERFAAQVRANRRLRTLLAGVAVALVVALIAGLLAVQQWSRADDQAVEAEQQRTLAETRSQEAGVARADAETRRLLSDAALLATENRQLALLLAAEAYRRSPDGESSAGLARVMTSVDGLLAVVGGGTPYLGVHWIDDDVVVGVREYGIDRLRIGEADPEASFEVPAGILAVPNINANSTHPAAGISHDGTRLAVGDSAGVLTVLDAATFESHLEIDVGSPVRAVRFGPQSDLIAVGTSDGALVLVDPATGDSQSVLAHPERSLGDLEYPDESVAPTPNQVEIAEELAWLEARALAFSPDGTEIYTGSVVVRRWSTASLEPVGFELHATLEVEPGLHIPLPVDAIHIVDDEAVVETGARLLWFDTATGHLTADVNVSLRGDININVGGVAFRDDGSAVVALKNGVVSTINPRTGEIIDGEAELQRGWVGDLDLSEHEDRLAVATVDGVVLWSADGSQLLGQAQLAGTFTDAFVDSTGELVSGYDSIGTDRSVFARTTAVPPELVDIGIDQELGPVHVIPTHGTDVLVHNLGWDPDQFSLMATLYRLDGQQLATVPVNLGWAVSADLRWWAISKLENGEVSLHVHDTTTGGQIARLDQIEDITQPSDTAVISSGFHPDGSRLIGTLSSGAAMIWDTSTWDVVAQIEPGQAVFASYSPDGGKLITSDIDGVLAVRHPDTLEIQRTIVGNTSSQELFSPRPGFSADGRYAVTAFDGTPPPLRPRAGQADRHVPRQRQLHHHPSRRPTYGQHRRRRCPSLEPRYRHLASARLPGCRAQHDRRRMDPVRPQGRTIRHDMLGLPSPQLAEPSPGDRPTSRSDYPTGPTSDQHLCKESAP